MEKTSKIDSQNNESNYTGLTKVDAPAIHTMPRRFINAKVDGDESHKGMGILILGIGIITLVLGAVFVYFYVYNPEIFTQSGLINSSDVANKTASVPVNKTDDILKNPSEENTAVAVSDKNTKTAQVIKDEKSDQTLNEFSTTTKNDISSTTALNDISTSSEISVVIVKKPVSELKKYLPGPDEDSDGLSDEEEAIFGTDKKIVDSDGDSYSDFAELKNFYNPSGDGKLIVNSGIEKYKNKTLGYSLYYPKNWIVNDANSGESVVFKIDKLQFIQLVVIENKDEQSIEDWYKEQFEVNLIKNEQKVNKVGWDGVKSDNGLIYYLSQPEKNNIFIINYSLGDETVLSYNNIFSLMIDSLELE